MHRLVPPLGLMAAALVLGACVTEEPRAVIVPPPAGVEGRWADTSGVSVSTLSSGRFTTTANDTGSVLAEGNYRTLGPGQISIEYTSLLRGERVAANCNQVAADRLSCVNSGGTRFDLTRRA